jgi:hypothetical protein
MWSSRYSYYYVHLSSYHEFFGRKQRNEVDQLPILSNVSAHPFAREGRLQLVLLGLQLVREGRLPLKMRTALQMATYNFALSWYAHPPMYVHLHLSS